MQSPPSFSLHVNWINALISTIVSTVIASFISVYPAVYLRDPLNTAIFTTVVVPVIIIVPFGFLVAAYVYNRLGSQQIQLSRVFSVVIIFAFEFIIVFYLIGLLLMFLRMLFGASVEDLSAASDHIICANTVLAYASTLLLGFWFAAQGPRRSDVAFATSDSVTNVMRNVIIAMIVMLILTAVVFLILFL